MPTLRRLPAALACAALALAGAVMSCAGGTDSGSYVAANDDIWHALPVLPGASVKEKHDSPYYQDSGGSPIGYTTNITYTAPASTTANDVIQFYTDSLGSDWRHCDNNQQKVEVQPLGQTPGPIIGTTLGELFVRARAMVNVTTFGMSTTSGGTYEIAIDGDVKTEPCAGA